MARDFNYDIYPHINNDTYTDLILYLTETNCSMCELVKNYPNIFAVHEEEWIGIFDHKFDINVLVEIINGPNPKYVYSYFNIAGNTFTMNKHILDLLLKNDLVKSIDDPIFCYACIKISFDDDCFEWLVNNRYKFIYDNCLFFTLNNMISDKRLSLLASNGYTDVLCYIISNIFDADIIKKVIDIIYVPDYIEYCTKSKHSENYLLTLDIINKHGIDIFMDIQSANRQIGIFNMRQVNRYNLIKELVSIIDQDVLIHIVAYYWSH